MIPVFIHTNLDLNCNERWPVELPCRPVKGDIIESNTGLELEVCRIAFKTVEDPDYIYIVVRCYVELTVPKGRFYSLDEFYEWYQLPRH
jgi:hypothetical protein